MPAVLPDFRLLSTRPWQHNIPAKTPGRLGPCVV